MQKTYSGKLEYPGYQRTPSLCQIDIWREGEKAVVMMTEIADNHGTSITNCSEVIASLVHFQHNLSGYNVTWIEHYGPMSDRSGRHKTVYAQATYDWSSGKPIHPEWVSLTEAQVETLVNA